MQDTQDTFDWHASEEVLERYSLGTLDEAELASFEEHLLVCQRCQDRLAEMDAFVRATREAARKLHAAPAGRAAWLGKFNLPDRVWTSALVGLAVVLGVLGWWNLRREASAPPVAVVLESYRGGAGLPSVQAPAGRPLLLRLDLTGVPELASYELEVVNAQGGTVQRAVLRRTGANPETTLTRLQPGQYWIRLYSQPQRELLREFGLRVE
jgi:hypothetical protein